MRWRVKSDTPALDWDAHKIMSITYKYLELAEGAADLLREIRKQNGQPRYANIRVEESK